MRFKLSAEESNLMAMYYNGSGSRAKMINQLALVQMRGTPLDPALRTLMDATIAKLERMTDEEFYQLEKEILLEESEEHA